MRERVTWTRRIFIRKSLKGWLGLVLGPALYGLGRALGRSSASNLASQKDVGSDSGIGFGMSTTVQYGNKRVMIIRDRQGLLHALSATCTHMGCSVRFEASGDAGQIACNCHDSRFSLAGEKLSGPAAKPLEEFVIESVGGRLLLSESRGKARTDL
jgi:Rieske Fe-S protein